MANQSPEPLEAFAALIRKYLPLARLSSMKHLFPALAVSMSWFVPGIVTAADPEPTVPTPIRAFDLATLSRLGREIHLQDQLAWKATDLVIAQIGMERLRKDGGRGWVVDTSNPKVRLVRFIRQGETGLEALCDITFADGDAPELSVPSNRNLTPRQLFQAVALETAKARFMEAKLPWCGGNPNTVVLDDPDGSGFLVYFLRAKPAMDQVPIGGHYRFTVSPDGKSVEQVDRLFASCLTLPKQAPQGTTPTALMLSHVISPTPIETHVFLSLQEGLPFAIVTMDRKLWAVENGEIRQQGTLDDPKSPANRK